MLSRFPYLFSYGSSVDYIFLLMLSLLGFNTKVILSLKFGRIHLENHLGLLSEREREYRKDLKYFFFFFFY